MAKKKVEDPVTHEVTEVDDGLPASAAPKAKPWEVVEASQTVVGVPPVEPEPEPEPEPEQPAEEPAPEPEQPAEEPVVLVLHGDNFVTVTVPRYFRLTMPDHTVKEVHPGVQPMLREHAEHWWSKANGVVEYSRVQLAAELPQAITIKQLVTEKFQALDSLPAPEKETAVKELFAKLHEAIQAIG